MHELGYLSDILIILSLSIIVLIVFNKLRLPAIAGFILTGIILGPQGFKIIKNAGHVELLAEIGVALLLFGIGVELVINKLKRLWKNIIFGGLLQVGLSIAAVVIISNFFGLNAKQSIFIGIVIALSSTAIVLRGLQQKGEVDSPHGQLILGILVFQDFSVIPAMLIIPFLTGLSIDTGSFVITLLKAVAIIISVLILALLIVPGILKIVAKTRQRQLFVLTVFVICLGTAWLVTRSGASLAIGAFLAGLVVSGSEYRHQAMSDMIPFREIFSGLFFVSIGMLLSPLLIVENYKEIFFLLALILLGKSAIIFMTAWIMKKSIRIRIISAMTLAQVGEFSFILLYLIKETDLLSSSLANNLLSAAILSMFITPFNISLAHKIAPLLGRFKIIRKPKKHPTKDNTINKPCELCDHIIIAGYGFAGKELALALNKCDILYTVVDLNYQNIKQALEMTPNVFYGDVTNIDVLKKLNIDKAKEIVILINDTNAALNATRIARQLTKEILITVRTAYLQDIESFKKAGADDIIIAEREAAVQVSAQVMKRNSVEPERLNRITSTIRTREEDVND